MEKIPGLDAWLTRDQDFPDCKCPEWMTDNCCGFCDGEPGCCECDAVTYWENIAEAHHEYCPIAIAATKQTKSSLCLCRELYKGEADARIESDDRELEKGS